MSNGFAFSSVLVAAGVMSAVSIAAADPLAGLMWKVRPVIVLADDPSDPRFISQIAALDARTKALADYQIKVVRVSQADPALRRKLDVPPRGFAVVLVGKDGGVKESWTQPVDPARIFAAIDTMPMRRDEVRGKR